jgi:site-specific recombinase XerD
MEKGLLKDRLDDYLTITKNLINELSLKKINSCSELKKELIQNLKLKITGKPPKGYKTDFISKLNDYTYHSVMNLLFKDRNTSEGRKRGYDMGYKLLKEFYTDDIPTINQITTDDLEQFKNWVSKKYSNRNTLTDYLSKVSSVIKFGVKLKIISVNPLPEKFRGSWEDGDRKVLSESECFKIMNLSEDKLSNTELVSKFCFMVQLLTGMGYSEMKNLTHEHIKYSENEDQYYIEKERNKTGIKFKIFLSENGLNYVNKLRELTGDSKRPFNIPSIDYSLRMYKDLGKKVGIKNNITTYTLRHTFSVNYMENDGRIEDLSKILGHSNLKTTQIYGKISNKRLSEKMRELEQKSKIHQIQKPHYKLHAV